MNIFVNVPRKTPIFKKYFPKFLLDRLERCGKVTYYDGEENLSREKIIPYLADAEIILTHWGSVQFDSEMLDACPNLKLLCHCTGSVAKIAHEEVYNRNIKVVSANTEMARHVAEVTLCLMLSSLHKIPQCDKSVRQNTLKHPNLDFLSLYGASIGMVGLGTIGRFLLDLLVPFGCNIKIYDPFIEASAISKWENASLSTLDEAISQPIVTIHASRTPETYHMINAEKLSLIPDGGILINTARAEIVDTKALIEEMKNGRIFAAVDVYDEEKVETLPTDILHFPNKSILTPHIGAASATWHLTNAALSDIERFVRKEELQYEVSRRQFELMTR